MNCCALVCTLMQAGMNDVLGPLPVDRKCCETETVTIMEHSE